MTKDLETSAIEIFIWGEAGEATTNRREKGLSNADVQYPFKKWEGVEAHGDLSMDFPRRFGEKQELIKKRATCFQCIFEISSSLYYDLSHYYSIQSREIKWWHYAAMLYREIDLNWMSSRLSQWLGLETLNKGAQSVIALFNPGVAQFFIAQGV